MFQGEPPRLGDDMVCEPDGVAGGNHGLVASTQEPRIAANLPWAQSEHGAKRLGEVGRAGKAARLGGLGDPLSAVVGEYARRAIQTMVPDELGGGLA